MSSFETEISRIAKKYEIPEDLFGQLAKQVVKLDRPNAAASAVSAAPVAPKVESPTVEPKFAPPVQPAPEPLDVPRVSLIDQFLAGDLTFPAAKSPRAPAQKGRKLAAGVPTVPGASLPAAGPVRYAAGKVLPLSTRLPTSSAFRVPDPEGAPDASGRRYHAAVDWFAPANSVVRSPLAGRVVEARRSRGTAGQVYGGTVKIQFADGRVAVFRHVSPNVRVGQKLKAGAAIARVTRWSDNPRSSHAHIELWRTLGGGYRLENMLDPLSLFRN